MKFLTAIPLVLVVVSCDALLNFAGFNVNKRCDEPYGTELHIRTAVRSLVQCCSLCQLVSTCNSVMYKSGSNTCKLYTGKAETFPLGCSTLWAYAERRSASVHYGACAVDSECPATNSFCYEGVCECNWGYSYNPANHSCLTYCENYGTTFSAIIDHVVFGYNFLILSSSKDDCKASCLSASSRCRTAKYDISSSLCYLSDETPLTKPAEFVYIADRISFVRNCL